MNSGKIDKRGMFHNRITDEDVNRGGRGKLNAEQLQERAELHAKRKVQGYPTINAICQHWFDTYTIVMHPRSEKEWAATESNAQWINNVAEDLIAKGDLAYPVPTVQSVTNTLTTGAKANADLIIIAKAKVKNLLKGFDEIPIKDKKVVSLILKDISKVVKDHSDSLLDMLKYATEIGRQQSVWEAEQQRKLKISKNESLEKKATITTEVGTTSLDEIERLRKKAGIDE